MEMAAAEMLYSVKREEMEEGRDPEGDRQVEHPCVYHLDLMLTVLGQTLMYEHDDLRPPQQSCTTRAAHLELPLEGRPITQEEAENACV